MLEELTQGAEQMVVYLQGGRCRDQAQRGRGRRDSPSQGPVQTVQVRLGSGTGGGKASQWRSRTKNGERDRRWGGRTACERFR